MTTTISIIGSGNMAIAIATRATKHGHTIELMSRNTAKAQALADQIGNGATVGTFGARPAGDIVIVAVLHAGAVEAVAHYGEALSGKILVDIKVQRRCKWARDDRGQLGVRADRRRRPRGRTRREGIQYDPRRRAC